jgi:hypothetical protein
MTSMTTMTTNFVLPTNRRPHVITDHAFRLFGSSDRAHAARSRLTEFHQTAPPREATK